MSTPRRQSSRRMAVAPAIDCKSAPEYFRGFLEGALTPAEEIAIRAHLEGCPRCAHAIKDHKQLHALLAQTVGASALGQDFSARADQRLQERRRISSAEGTSAKGITAVHLGLEGEEEEEYVAAAPAGLLDSLAARFGAAPWWIISGSFHGLLILLLFLIGLAVMQIKKNETVILTSLEKQIEPPEIKQPPERDVIQKPVPIESELPPVESPVVTHEEVEIADHNETDNDVDAQEALGEEGISDVPLGGTGFSGAIGVGGGGGGAFGQRGLGGRRRLAMAGGGGQATESAVDKALEWLARHQEADGHWDVRKYEGKNEVDPGVTGLAVLAFLGAGHTEKVGKYKDNVQRGIRWIISQQAADGGIGASYKEFWHPGHAYHHAICGLALAEASGMAKVPETVAAANKAIHWTTEIHQGGDGSEKEAWRYNAKQKADASVSGWFVMQLKSAKIAGLQVNPASFEGAMKFYDSIEIKEGGEYGGGKFPYQKGGKTALNTSAIGILCNLFLGRNPAELQGGAEYLHQNLPRWDAKLGEGGVGGGGRSFPMYYIYYSTLTMFQMGGHYWKDWNEALKATLLPKQRRDGDMDGSWDPMGGADDGMAGRVYMTAMGALCLEVYYRYLPITRK